MTRTDTTKTDITTIITSRGTAQIEIARMARAIPEIEILAQEYRGAWAAHYRAQHELLAANELLCSSTNRARTLFLANPVRASDVETMATLASAYAASAPAGRAAIRNELVSVKVRMVGSVDPDNQGLVESMFEDAIATGAAIMAAERCTATIRDIKAELMDLAN